MLPLLLAPIQGYTDAIYRENLARHIGGIEHYYTPFIRLQKGEPRPRDLKDALPENNPSTHTVPQIIFSGPDEFQKLVKSLEQAGFTEIDLNLGCPYPMQTGHGRGSGMLPHPDIVKQIADKINKLNHIHFSIKMRLGLDHDGEGLQLLPVLNNIPLKHITLHPRLGRQQYKGALDMQAFEQFYEQCKHPLIFNGDIQNIGQIHAFKTKYPKLSGVMIGRGLLAQPTLAAEYMSGRPWSAEERLLAILKMHQGFLDDATRLCPEENQILNRMHAFWEFQTALPAKLHKQIMKSKRLNDYKKIFEVTEASSLGV